MSQPVDEDVTLPPPPYTSPVLDQNSLLAVTWLTWFRQLYLRVGQAVAPSNTQILTNPMDTLGDMLFENGTPAIDRLPGNTTATKKFLTQTGTGSVSANPGWNTILAGDVPTLNQDTTGNAATATTATNATNTVNTAITNDAATNATMYPTWVTANSGNLPQKVSSTKLTFNPSTGALTTTTFVGALTGTASGNTTYSANNHGVVLSSATNTMTVIAPDASTTKALISGGASADPAWGTLAIGGGGTGQTSKAAAFDALSPMSTGGDIIYGGSSGTGTRLANGNAGQVLTSNGTTLAPSWQSVTASAPTSEIWLDTGNGHGSTNTKIRRFTNNPVANGSDMTLTQSSTNGDSITINTAGIYAISYSDSRNGADTIIGISVNSTQLTTSIMSITTANRIQAGGGDNSAIGGDTTAVYNVSAVVHLSVNDVVRAHDDGNCTGTGAPVKFIITRVA